MKYLPCVQVLRVMSKCAMFSSHITLTIFNFDSFAVKLKKAGISYSYGQYIF